jgi:dissimilatory sulfite reductase (desulfoviridin) alpha/beta subunit
MTKLITLRIFTNGGIITPEELRKITQVARLAGCSHLMPGSRQELYLQVEEKHLIHCRKRVKEK